jgi:hypothetical protein
LEDDLVFPRLGPPHRGCTQEVAYLGRGGVALITGTVDEVQAWLDDQGDQTFVGTRSAATAWIDELRDADKSFVVRRNRFRTTPDGEEGLIYLCPSHQLFFCHVEPAMRMTSRLLRPGRAPAEIVRLGVLDG